MEHSTKVIRVILEGSVISRDDILYALSLRGVTVSKVAADCGCSREVVYAVIRGDRHSLDIATYIADKLSTTTKRLWGDTYNYTPRKTHHIVKSAANS